MNGGGAGASGYMPLTLPSMTFVRDVTIGEGESVPPSTDFTKTWTVLNSGNEPWPEGTLFSCNICELPNYLQLKLGLDSIFKQDKFFVYFRLYVKVYTGQSNVRRQVNPFR